MTPIQQKIGPPVLKRSSLSKLADGFRTAAYLNNESENDDDPFGLSFRNEQVLMSKCAPAPEKRPETLTLDPSKCLPERDMEMYRKIKKLDKFYGNNY